MYTAGLLCVEAGKGRAILPFFPGICMVSAQNDFTGETNTNAVTYQVTDELGSEQ